ncbi:MAG: MATE family efflux transporter [Candidatus Eremiobacteraeota bacterium]|nr:MATE family efflux transporter [Candidatus Eremiobacteraeota bacterium]MBV8355348.1 MATE family efflux transporter [Candidatus Eremiobacteraeota bacterium]
MQGRSASIALDDSRPIWRSLLIFLLPLMGSNALQSLGQTINSIYLGKLLGTLAFAAAGNFFPIIFLVISFLIGLGSASSVLIGQAYGAHDLHRVKAVAGTSLGFALILGIGLGALCAVFTAPLLHLIGTPPDIFSLSLQYARVIFISFPVFFVYLIYSTFLRGVGDSRTPFLFLMLSTALTMIFTPAFILGWAGLPRLGVISAAWSNIVSSMLTLVAMWVYLRRKGSPLAPDAEMLRDLLPRGRILANLIRIGIPTSLQMIIVSLAEIAVLAFVNRYGSDATAAYAAVNQVVGYVQFPAISIGIAASIFGAQSIGAGRSDRLGPIVRSAVGLNYVLEGVMIGLCYLLASEILGLFLTKPSTHAIARELLYITIWSYAIFGNAAVISGLVRSSGDVIWPLTISVCSIWLVEVPVAYVLSFRVGLGLPGIWLGYPAAFIANVLGQFAYYELVWRHKPLRPIH